MSEWNSEQYIKFKKERTQPSIDLINRIDIRPQSILDIGCGPGNSTNRLKLSFPNADIIGIDSSDNMLSEAISSYPELHFEKAAVPGCLDKLKAFDLIFSNACLHWVSDHEALLPALLKKLTPGGVLAVQMPLVQNAPFYKLLNELTAEYKWRTLSDISIFHNPSPEAAYDILSAHTSNITMWESTYYHVLPTAASVIDWYSGSGLRPYLERLSTDKREEFLSELLAKVNNAYSPQADNRVILKMPRLFYLAYRE